MTPELCIPSFIQCFDCFILILQPHSKCLFTVFTITRTTIFIVDMPAGHMLIVCITLSKLFNQCRCIFLIYGRIWTSIVTFSKFLFSALVIHSCHFRIFFDQPCWHCCSRCSHDNIIVLSTQHFHNFIQLTEIIHIFRGLNLCP